jgi:hypothetical protein
MKLHELKLMVSRSGMFLESVRKPSLPLPLSAGGHRGPPRTAAAAPRETCTGVRPWAPAMGGQPGSSYRLLFALFLFSILG